jgi:hypothetical protein
MHAHIRLQLHYVGEIAEGARDVRGVAEVLPYRHTPLKERGCGCEIPAIAGVKTGDADWGLRLGVPLFRFLLAVVFSPPFSISQVGHKRGGLGAPSIQTF